MTPHRLRFPASSDFEEPSSRSICGRLANIDRLGRLIMCGVYPLQKGTVPSGRHSDVGDRERYVMYVETSDGVPSLSWFWALLSGSIDAT